MATTEIFNSGVTTRYYGEKIAISTPMNRDEMEMYCGILNRTKSVKITNAILDTFKASRNSYGWIVFEDSAYMINGNTGYVESKASVEYYVSQVLPQPAIEEEEEEEEEKVEASQEAQPIPEQFQFNIGSFFQAVYDYCYSQVSDYLPQPHDYLYGSPNRPMSTTWAHIEEAHYIQVDRRTEGVYTWVAVPYQLSLKVMENYELTFIKAPESLQVAWNDLRSVPYVKRSLEHKPGICDQCGHPDAFFYPLRLDGCTEWYCGACFELHVLCHSQRSVDRYEGENYQEGKLQPVKL